MDRDFDWEYVLLLCWIFDVVDWFNLIKFRMVGVLSIIRIFYWFIYYVYFLGLKLLIVDFKVKIWIDIILIKKV